MEKQNQNKAKTQQEKQIVFSSGKVIPNDTEIRYAESVGALGFLDKEYIALIKRFDKKNIHTLNSKNTTSFSNEFDGFQDSFPESEVIVLFQLSKGYERSKNQLRTIHESQLNSKSLPTIAFQEDSRKEDLASFKKLLNYISQEFMTEKKKYFVFEIESKDIEDKITLTLSSGFKNFIIRAGEYGNLEKWLEIRELIRKAKGTFLVSLPRRMDKNRVSHIKTALGYGANLVFHEKQSPPYETPKEVLHMNSKFSYVSMDFDVASKDYKDDFAKLTGSKNYDFSRVRTLLRANSFASTIEVLNVSDTK